MEPELMELMGALERDRDGVSDKRLAEALAAIGTAAGSVDVDSADDDVVIQLAEWSDTANAIRSEQGRRSQSRADYGRAAKELVASLVGKPVEEIQPPPPVAAAASTRTGIFNVPRAYRPRPTATRGALGSSRRSFLTASGQRTADVDEFRESMIEAFKRMNPKWMLGVLGDGIRRD